MGVSLLLLTVFISCTLARFSAGVARTAGNQQTPAVWANGPVRRGIMKGWEKIIVQKKAVNRSVFDINSKKPLKTTDLLIRFFAQNRGFIVCFFGYK